MEGGRGENTPSYITWFDYSRNNTEDVLHIGSIGMCTTGRGGRITREKIN